MGRGAAYEASKIFPSLPTELGLNLIKTNRAGKTYGIFIFPCFEINHPTRHLIYAGAFQVKYHWKDPASLKLIQISTDQLNVVATAMPFSRFAMNFPGIGNGGLNRSEVLPIIENLPDNVYVYER
jgi:hypothetical protein